jgi:hypothetical protein
MNRWTRSLAGIVMGMMVISGSAADAPAPAEKSIGYLFVQTAQTGAYADGVLTLDGVPEQTVFFSDRPARKAGHLSTKKFLEVWKEGSNSFQQDPPNATLSILNGERVTTAVLELRNPLQTGNQLQYTVTVLEGMPPASFGAASLFLDIVMTGGGPGPQSSPFEFPL